MTAKNPDEMNAEERRRELWGWVQFRQSLDPESVRLVDDVRRLRLGRRLHVTEVAVDAS